MTLTPERKVYALTATVGAAAELVEAADGRVKAAETALLQDVARLRALSPAPKVGNPEVVERRDCGFRRKPPTYSNLMPPSVLT